MNYTMVCGAGPGNSAAVRRTICGGGRTLIATACAFPVSVMSSISGLPYSEKKMSR